MSYRVVIAGLDGGAYDEVPAKNLQFTYVLNKPGSIGFTLPLRHPKTNPTTLAPGKREIKVYRDGVLVWGGYLWDAQISGEEVRFGGEGYFSRLKHRYISTTVTFTQQDQTDIAWSLINTTQSTDDLGFTDAHSTTGILRDRTYIGAERKFIAEAIEQLSAVEDGFDFEITPAKEFKTYYPKKGQNIAVIFELGKNIRSYECQWLASNVASEITAIGEGQGDASLLSVASDVVATSEFGLLQDTRSFKDISVQSTLDKHATEELRLAKQARVIPGVQLVTQDPPWGAYGVGDQASLRIRNGYTQINDIFRISVINVQVSNEGFEAIGINFDEAAL